MEIKNRNSTFLLFFTILLSSFFSNAQNTTIKHFSVQVEQGKELKSISENAVFLKDSIFDIVLEFSEPMGVIIHASHDDQTFQLALKNKDLEKLPGFESSGMAEGTGNQDSTLLLCRNAPSFWFYDELENRFDSCIAGENGITCKRTIKTFFDVDKLSSEISGSFNSPLFLVFVSYIYSDNYERIEVQRQCLVLNFED